MPKYTTADIRNLAIVGSGATGKTTLVEMMLNVAGLTGRVGRVEDGNTVTDFDELEKEYGSSIDSALVHFDYGGAHFNVIDTPGASDFLGKAIGALAAVETAVFVVGAGAGIDPVFRRLMKVAAECELPRFIVINKIDHEADLAEQLAHLQEAFGSAVRPINLPANGGKAVVDCFGPSEGSSDLGNVAEFHTGIVDQVVEVDERLMEEYLESGALAPEKVHGAFCRALCEGHLVPVCFTSARENVGVKELLDVLAAQCPSPIEGNRRAFEYTKDGEQKEIVPEPDSAKPLIGHVFKVSSDPYVGKLCFVRVHQGHLGPDVAPRVGHGKKGIRIAHVFKLQGKEHKEEPMIIAGDIGAVAKIEEIDYNATLHGGDEDLHAKPIPLPKPMFGLAIEGTSKGADAKIGDALRKLMAEDGTLEVERVQTTGETVLRGLGEQHLRVKLRMLKDRYGIEVATRPPKIPYRETISAKAEGHHRHKKQTGGAGQFGEVYLRVEPLSKEDRAEAPADGLVFVDATFGGSIPRQFLPAVEKGVRKVMSEGAIAGYPLQNIKVSVYDGKYHAVDSKEVAFVAAGRKAFRDAIQKAKPVILEPYVHLEITIPADMVGDISSDISGRRGRIQGTDVLPGNQAVVTAQAPLAEVMAYSSQLKSLTGGAGSYTMEYSHDEPTPPNIQANVVAAHKPKEEED